MPLLSVICLLTVILMERIMQNMPRITCFLIKIASRCNLACDYCYMYRHADQSWQSQPFVMSANHRNLLAFRIAEYVKVNQSKEIVVVFHGGEPLLAGIETIVETTQRIRDSLPYFCKVDFSLQSNGVLLTQSILNKLKLYKIGVSLSIDGPKEAHDRHRVDHKGLSSFEAVEKSLKLLMDYPSIYSGLIAVIDPLIKPENLFDFFADFNPPQIDFLLPDANYNKLPPGRDKNLDLYSSWLIKAFDLWFEKYSYIPVRTFDSILRSIVGLPGDTDSFGFGDVSLLTIETDGSYHDLDVLKITENGFTSLGTTLDDCDIATAISSSFQIQEHRKYLTLEGLSTECQTCSIVNICGGGSIPHRYAEDGFKHPTVYCHEMMELIHHAKKRLSHQLELENKNCKTQIDINKKTINKINLKILEFEQPETSKSFIEIILDAWIKHSNENLKYALDWAYRKGCEQEVISKIQFKIKNFPRISIFPSITMWVSSVNRKLAEIKTYSVDGDELIVDPFYPRQILNLLTKLDELDFFDHLIHRNDQYLRLPFGKNILFEDDSTALQGKALVQESLLIIESWRPSLAEEMRLISPEIQLIKDLTAHPDKIVSFSDDIVPGSLYVSIRQGEKMISAYDLADSLIHEHRHQKLYLLQRLLPLVAKDTPLVSSPWRDDLRPPSGLLHAAFVFTHLLEFWMALIEDGNLSRDCISQDKARKQVSLIKSRLLTAFETLKQTSLTEVGFDLIAQLEEKINTLKN